MNTLTTDAPFLTKERAHLACKARRKDRVYEMNPVLRKALARAKPLPAEEQTRLACKAKRKDIDARNTLLSTSLRIIYNEASKKADQMPFMDLYSFGIEFFLTTIIRRFNSRKSASFATWTAYNLDLALTRFIKNNKHVVRHPAHWKGKTKKGDPIAILSADIEDSSERTLLDTMESTDPTPSEIFERKDIVCILDTLDARERNILVKLYGIGGDEPKRFAEIGREIGLTRERVRQIAAGALAKLRKRI